MKPLKLAICILILFGTLCLSASAFIVPTYLGVHLGDVSGDGQITAYDAELVLQFVVGLIELSPEQQQAADVSGDGIITAYDADLILQYIVELISEFSAEGTRIAVAPAPVILRVEDVSGKTGDDVSVYIRAEDVPQPPIPEPTPIELSKYVRAIQFSFMCDVNLLEVTGVELVDLTAGTVDIRPWMMEYNIIKDIDGNPTGEVKIALAQNPGLPGDDQETPPNPPNEVGIYSLPEDGRIIRIAVHVKEAQETDLILESPQINEGTPDVMAINGRFSPGLGSINGHVMDRETEEPIFKAIVIAIQEETKVRTITNRYGYYEIEELQPGIWWILCIKKGYKFGIARIEVKAGEITTHDFSLKPKE